MKTFTIVSTIDQKKYVINTEASTMKELTEAMDVAGIRYKGMTLYEGLTKAEYNPDNLEAVLPHDVPYKGTTTNNLVFQISAPQKKIESGASYKEMKEMVKNQNLGEAFKEAFGKNYTHATTDELEAFLDNINASAVKVCTAKVFLKDELVEAFTAFVDALFESNEEECKGPKSPYSDEDLEEMFQ